MTSWIYKKHREKPREHFEIEVFDSQRDFLAQAAPITRHIEASPNALAALRDSIDQARQLLRERPADMLGGLCFYFLSWNFKEWKEKDVYLHADQELLQALVLAEEWESPSEMFSPPPLSPAENISQFETRCVDLTPVSECSKRIRDAFMAHHEYVLSSVSEDSDLDEGRLKLRARLVTLSQRNWASIPRMGSLVSRLFAQFDQIFLDKYGLTAKELVEFFQRLNMEVAHRINVHLEKKLSLHRSQDPALLRQLYEMSWEDPEFSELNRISATASDPLDVQRMFIMESDCFISRVFVFEFSQLQKMSAAKSETHLKVLLNALSLKPGSLANESQEFLLLTNPVWERPIIEVGDKFFVPAVHVLTSFCLPIVERLFLECAPEQKSSYESFRAAFLENQAFSCISRCFPSAAVAKNLASWTSEQGENDIVAFQDEFTLVLEAKSAKASASAKRGGDSLPQTLRRVIGKAHRQGVRFERMLRANSKVGPVTNQDGKIVEVDSPQPKCVIRVTLMLDPFFGDIADMATTSSGRTMVMSLSDLELAMDVLRSPSERWYYFWARQILSKSVEYGGDETDLLGTYVSVGFDWRKLAGNDATFNLVGASRFLKDPAHDLAPGIISHRPMTGWWMDCITAVDQSFARLAISIFMWDVPYDVQLQLEEARIQTAKQIENPKSSDPLVFLVRAVTFAELSIIIGLVFKDASQHPFPSMAHETARKMLEPLEHKRALVLIFDLRKRRYPFHDCLLFP